jgi:hypothetical protein
MNTKSFFLLVCLLTTNHTTPVLNKETPAFPAVVVEQPTSSSKETGYRSDLTLPDPLPDFGSNHAEKGPKEHEDGKHHNFHFSRVPASRRRNLLVVVSKLVLTMLHICVFIYCFMHPFH